MSPYLGCRDAAEVIRAEADDILYRWIDAVRNDEEVSTADKQPALVLIDHLPEIIEGLASRLESVGDPDEPARQYTFNSKKQNSVNLHAYERFHSGYTLDELMKELAHLRIGLLQVFWRRGVELDLTARVTLHSLLDAIAARAVSDMARWEHRLLESVVMQSEEGIAVVNSSGRFLLFNPEAESLLGQGPQDVDPEEWQRVYSLYTARGDLMPADEVPLARALRGEVVMDYLFQVQRPDGQVRWFESSAWPIHDENDILVGGVVLFRDRTERRQAEEYRQKTERFRDQFLGILGHDLRTPLTAIRMSTELLLRKQEAQPSAFKTEVLRVLPRIESSTERILRMMDDLLDFTRGRLGGRMPVQRRDADLAELYRTVKSDLAAAEPARDFKCKVAGDVTGCWDPDRLMQVLSNLLGNAIHYSAEGSPITVVLSDQGDEVQICVNNQGPPIPPEEQEHIFAPFRRGLGRDVQDQSQGIGLGLYIVKMIVLAHEGEIQLGSDEESGTTFRVILPRRPGKESQGTDREGGVRDLSPTVSDQPRAVAPQDPPQAE